MLDFSTRLVAEEMMDDFSIVDDRLFRALDDLAWINRLLGGWAATDAVLDPFLRRGTALRVLDVGTGGADYPIHLVHRAERLGCRVEVVGLDANPVTVGYARAVADRMLAPDLRGRLSIEIGDALSLPYPDDTFDVTHAGLFLHHFHGAEAVQLLREMQRVSRLGLLVNDLHRHPVAYAGIWLLSRLTGASPMVQNDGPISVRRGFHRADLHTLAHRAALPHPTVRWHPLFRWTLTTFGGGKR